MSYRVTKLVVGKGKTVADEQNGEWIKNYYEIEMDIPEEHELGVAKENAEGLLNEWLGTQQTRSATAPLTHPKWDAAKIKWQEANGGKGPYQRSDDIDSLDHKALMKDLADHKGFLRREGYQYWRFENGSTVGRRKLA